VNLSETLIKSLAQFVELEEKEFVALGQYIKPISLKKDEYWLKEGQICDFVAFVSKGVLVYFKLLENGNESATDFAFAGEWVTDNRSRLNHCPSLLSIKALEPCELYVIKNNDLEICYQLAPKLERLGRILIEQAFVKIAQQSIDLQTLSATQRYHKLLTEHPEIFQKVPLYHIANYLGIAPKSLSRIRNTSF
jgi:CRP/FNR family transcriptional regulator, anaerobic regulatory protein